MVDWGNRDPRKQGHNEIYLILLKTRLYGPAEDGSAINVMYDMVYLVPRGLAVGACA